MRPKKLDTILTEEFLRYHHETLDMSLLAIAKKVGCSHKTVKTYLDYYKIKHLQPKYGGRKMDQHNGWTGCGELSKTRFNGFRNNALTRNIPFEVSIEQLWELYLKQKRKCALSDMEIGFQSSNKANASLDRKNSNIPYTIENVWWVHRDVNYAKQSLSTTDFVELCRRVVEKNEHR